MTDLADIPPPLPWNERHKAVGTMPGGQSYVDTLRRICEFVVTTRPSQPELVDWTHSLFGLKHDVAGSRIGFLVKADVLEYRMGQITLGKHASRWHETRDHGILIGILHRKIRFVGEMLAELHQVPNSCDDLRQIAANYGLHWKDGGQIRRRKQYLESAGMIETVGDGKLAITKIGSQLLEMLEVHYPDQAAEVTPDITRAPRSSREPPTSNADATAPDSDHSMSAIQPANCEESGDPTPAQVLAAAEGYTMATTPRVVQQRLHQLGNQLASVAPRGDR